MKHNNTTPNTPATPVRRTGLAMAACIALTLAVVFGLGGWYFGRTILEKHAVSVAADEYWHALETGDWATIYQYAPSNRSYNTWNSQPFTVHGGIVVAPRPNPDMRLPGPDLSNPNTHIVAYRIDSVRVIDSSHADVTVAYRLAGSQPYPTYRPFTSPNYRNSWTPNNNDRNSWSRNDNTPTETRIAMAFCYTGDRWRLDISRIPRMDNWNDTFHSRFD